MNHLAQTLKALSDPVRLRIILLLQSQGELCVCDIMAALRLPQSTTSRHLAYLKRTCWVDTRRDGLWIHYSLSSSSCDICGDILEVLARHVQTLPEAAADSAALHSWNVSQNRSCAPSE